MVRWNVTVAAGMVAIAGVAGLQARGDVLYVSAYGGVGRFNEDGSFQAVVTDPGDHSVINNPGGFTFDAAGNFYISNYPGSGDSPLTNFIERVTPEGVATRFLTDGLQGPRGLAFDSAGNLYVANARGGTILKVTPAGVASTFATLAQYSLPVGLVFDGLGNLYVSTSYGLDKISPDGVVSVFNSAPGGETGYYGPNELAMDAAGNLYEPGGGGVIKFFPDGTPSQFIKGMMAPSGVAFDAAGNLFVAEDYGFPLVEFDPNGVEVRSITEPPFPFARIGDIVIRTEVPEPATVGVLGIVGLTGVRRRRGRREGRVR